MTFIAFCSSSTWIMRRPLWPFIGYNPRKRHYNVKAQLFLIANEDFCITSSIITQRCDYSRRPFIQMTAATKRSIPFHAHHARKHFNPLKTTSSTRKWHWQKFASVCMKGSRCGLVSAYHGKIFCITFLRRTYYHCQGCPNWNITQLTWSMSNKCFMVANFS